ncbi:hypothetical protein QTP70_002227 [Hemibagrus guttatus]|uniref:Uncharacterized protein n=1 Tax=Hemibagrus guttatus TaxID=175788 RepID=A0AAE0QW40_9TELE|nr:hypothetical protein QTP70_002227 [Hemibagrus guttatus]
MPVVVNLGLNRSVKNGPVPSYFKALITPRTAPRSLRSTSTARLVPPSLRIYCCNGKSTKGHMYAILNSFCSTLL